MQTHFGDIAKQTTCRLALSLGLTILFVFTEAIAGIIGNSLALLTDAAHNLTDVIALGSVSRYLPDTWAQSFSKIWVFRMEHWLPISSVVS